MSLRTFHESFLSRYGMTPKAYLRTLRIDAARRELMRAEPGVTVAEAAMRWCFFPLHWFSGEYQRAFGEGPSETLRRSAQIWCRRESTAPSARELGHAKK